MPLSDAGLTKIIDDIIGAGAVADFTNAVAALGVGDSTVAFAQGQTDLQAAVNKLRKGMDATFPSRSAKVLTAKATFAPSEANFAWEEWGFFNNVTADTMLCRKVESLGTKPGTQTWILTATMTFAN